MKCPLSFHMLERCVSHYLPLFVSFNNDNESDNYLSILENNEFQCKERKERETKEFYGIQEISCNLRSTGGLSSMALTRG